MTTLNLREGEGGEAPSAAAAALNLPLPSSRRTETREGDEQTNEREAFFPLGFGFRSSLLPPLLLNRQQPMHVDRGGPEPPPTFSLAE